MPGALHVEALKTAFRQRAEAVRAKFLEAIKVIVDLGDRYDLTVDLDAQCFSILETFRLVNWNEDDIGFFARSEIRR